MKLANRWPRPRDAFTLIELLVVMVLILVLAALGLGYIVFGQDNQHGFSAAQAVTGALLNAKQRARRDGLPTGVRIVFTSAPSPPYPAPPQPYPAPLPLSYGPTDNQRNPSFGTQLQLIQEPEPYSTGAWTGGDGSSVPNALTFQGTDFQGGAAYPGEIDESTVQAGDYFIDKISIAHRITQVLSQDASHQYDRLLLQSPATAPTTSSQYTILRAPRRLASEDVIQMPSNMIIDNSLVPGTGTPVPPYSGANYCRNLPQRTLIDFPPPTNNQRALQAAEILFAPSGAVVGQGTGADKIYLWLRDSNVKLWPSQNNTPPGAPLIMSIQIRTGLIGVFPVAPWAVGPTGDPYANAESARSSGL